MARGRPPLRIGEHGRITRVSVATGVWIARCRFRDADGVTRIVQKLGPKDDKHGLAAEDALLASLKGRRPPAAAGGVSADTLIMTLVDAHIDELERDGRSRVTIDVYRRAAKTLRKYVAGVRVGDAAPAARMYAAIKSVQRYHGDDQARQARTVLRGGWRLAVLADLVDQNPVNDIEIRSTRRRKGAPALSSGVELAELVSKVMASEDCQRRDLTDPIVLLAATGLRRSELLGLRWSDYNQAARTLTVAGKTTRAKGKGVQRVDDTKTEDSRRTVKIPLFAATVLDARRGRSIVGEADVIFPNALGGLRDPDKFGAAWRAARTALGVSDVSSHSFRKTVATLIDDAGLSARIGADQLGHSRPSMTMDNYMKRGQLHSEVADLLDRAVSGDTISDE
jgi:integrase